MSSCLWRITAMANVPERRHKIIGDLLLLYVCTNGPNYNRKEGRKQIDTYLPRSIE
jgi:hypothetical protein